MKINRMRIFNTRVYLTHINMLRGHSYENLSAQRVFERKFPDLQYVGETGRTLNQEL